MNRKIVTLGAVLVSGLFPATVLAQSSTSETSGYTNTVSTSQTTTPKTTSVEAETNSQSTAPASSGTPAAAATSPATAGTTNQLAYTGSNVWRGIFAGAALLALAAVVVLPRRRGIRRD